MMKSRLKHLLAGALLVLPLVLQTFVAAQTVHAGDDDNTPTETSTSNTTKVELTKLVFPKSEGDVTIDNNGKQTSALHNGTPVQGAVFQAYNITEAYAQALTDAKPEKNQTKEEAAIKSIQDGAEKAGNGKGYGTEFGDAVTTNQQGVADFELPNLDGKSTQYQTYLIVETQYADPEVNKDNTIIKRSTPLILTMPLNTAKSGDTVYLYPKNYDQPAITKDLTTPTDPSRSINQIANFTVKVAVPFDIATRSQFEVTDTPDAGLDDVKDSLQIKDDEGDVSKDFYTVAEQKEEGHGVGFKVTFTPAEMGALAGKTLTISYDAKVTVSVGKLHNTVSVDFNHNPHTVTSETPVTVGGAKFLKIDASSKKGLADAVFVLENAAGDIVTTDLDKDGKVVTISAPDLDLQKINAAGEGVTGADKLAAVKAELIAQLADNASAVNAVVALSSGTDGAFEFTGLKYDDYQAVEIAAPKGYALATSATPFTVSDTSYDDTNKTSITNTPKGILPSTGGMGIYLIIAAGLAVMIAGFLFLKKGSHREEV